MQVTFNKQDESFNIEGINKNQFLKIRFFLKLATLWFVQNQEHYLYTRENETFCESINRELEKVYIESIENQEVL